VWNVLVRDDVPTIVPVTVYRSYLSLQIDTSSTSRVMNGSSMYIKNFAEKVEWNGAEKLKSGRFIKGRILKFGSNILRIDLPYFAYPSSILFNSSMLIWKF